MKLGPFQMMVVLAIKLLPTCISEDTKPSVFIVLYYWYLLLVYCFVSMVLKLEGEMGQSSIT